MATRPGTTKEDVIISSQGNPEAGLRAREDLFSKVFRLVPDTLTLTRVSDGKFVDFSDAWEGLTGFSREEAIGRTSHELGVWAVPEQRERLIAAVRRDGEVRGFDVTFRHKQGHHYYCKVGATLFESSGETYLMLAVHDVTAELAAAAERQRIEMDLRASEERLQSILAGLPAGVVVRDVNGKVVMHNAAARRIYGDLSEVEMEQFTFDWPSHFEVMHDDGAPYRREELPAAVALATGRSVRDVVVGHRNRQTGVTVWALVNSEPIRDAAGTATVAVVSSFIDITQRKAIDKQLRESEHKFSSVFQYSPLPLTVVMPETGRILEANDAWLKQFGYSREEVIGRDTTDDLDFWVDLDDRRRMIARLAEKGVVEGEARLRRKDGSVLTCTQDGRLFALNGGSVLIMSTLDVTRQREMESEIRELNAGLELRVQERTRALELANRELEAYSYTVSHDLRAPLHQISGFTGLLKENLAGKLDDEDHRYMAAITNAAERMGRLIEDLLGFAKIGRAAIHKHHLQLDAMVAEVRSLISQQAGRRAIEWKIGPLPAVYADHGLFQLVLVNLLSNAVKYTRDAPDACVELGTITTPTDGAESVFFVRDNGAGFDMAYVERLFRPFSRLHSSSEFDGTGIGLATAKSIVQRHGGRIWAEAAPGQGATFFVALPRASAIGAEPD